VVLDGLTRNNKKWRKKRMNKLPNQKKRMQLTGMHSFIGWRGKGTGHLMTASDEEQRLPAAAS